MRWITMIGNSAISRIFIGVALLTMLGGCQTTAPERLQQSSWQDVPRYSGKVTPLSNPITLKHSPFGKVTFTAEAKITTKLNGNMTGGIKVNMRGSVWSDRADDKIAVTYKYDQIRFLGPMITEINEPIYARALISESGTIHDFVWDGEERFLDLFPPEQQTTDVTDLLENSLRNSITAFPRASVSQNSRVVLGHVSENGVLITTSGVLKGRTNINGEPSIVFDISMEVGAGKEGIPVGYHVISERTGRPMSTEVLMIIENFENQVGVSARMEVVSKFSN